MPLDNGNHSVWVTWVMALIGVVPGGCVSQGTGRPSPSSATAETSTGGDGSWIVDGVKKGVKSAVGARCRHVSGVAEVARKRREDGTIAWVVTISSDARAALEAHPIIGADGREYGDLVALDCFLDAVLSAADVCPGDWMHEMHDENIATHIDGGRLEVTGMCTSAGH